MTGRKAVGKTTCSGHQTGTVKGTCGDRPGLTAELDGAAADRAQINNCFVKQVKISQILPFALQSMEYE